MRQQIIILFKNQANIMDNTVKYLRYFSVRMLSVTS